MQVVIDWWFLLAIISWLFVLDNLDFYFDVGSNAYLSVKLFYVYFALRATILALAAVVLYPSLSPFVLNVLKTTGANGDVITNGIAAVFAILLITLIMVNVLQSLSFSVPTGGRKFSIENQFLRLRRMVSQRAHNKDARKLRIYMAKLSSLMKPEHLRRHYRLFISSMYDQAAAEKKYESAVKGAQGLSPHGEIDHYLTLILKEAGGIDYIRDLFNGKIIRELE